jgi:hypothetical protein
MFFLFLAMICICLVAFKYPSFYKNIVIPVLFGWPIGSILWSFLIQTNDDIFTLSGYFAITFGTIAAFIAIATILTRET